MMFIRIINTSTVGLRETFGRYSNTVLPGITFYVPLIQRIRTVNCRLQQDTFHFSTKTSDNVFTKLEVAVQYIVVPEDAHRAFYSLDIDQAESQIEAYVESVLRSTVSKRSLEQLYNQQNEICNEVYNNLSSRMREYGYTIQNTLIKEIMPDEKVVDAMNHVYASERMKESARNEAEANMIKQVKDAEAEKERRRLIGEGTSQQREAILRGYEKSIGEMSSKFNTNPKELMDFITRMQHLDTLHGIGVSNNCKTVFVDHKDPTFPESLQIK